MSTTLKAHLALLSVAFIYGANYSIAKVVMDDNYIQPLGFILLRVLAGSSFFILFHWWNIKEKVERQDFPLLILCGLLGVALNQMFFFSGLKFTTPINASLIMLTTPILVLICSAIILKEKVTWQKVIGIGLGILGAVMLIAYGKDMSFAQSQFKGDVMILINATCYGIYLVIVKKLMKKYHPFTVVRWVFTFGILFVFPFGINEVMEVNWSNIPSMVWGAIFYVLIFTTILAYLFNAFALKIVDASVVSVYIYLQPVIATMIALFMGKDSLSEVKIYAAILIFLGVYLSSYSKK